MQYLKLPRENVKNLLQDFKNKTDNYSKKYKMIIRVHDGNEYDRTVIQRLSDGQKFKLVEHDEHGCCFSTHYEFYKI